MLRGFPIGWRAVGHTKRSQDWTWSSQVATTSYPLMHEKMLLSQSEALLDEGFYEHSDWLVGSFHFSIEQVTPDVENLRRRSNLSSSSLAKSTSCSSTSVLCAPSWPWGGCGVSLLSNILSLELRTWKWILHDFCVLDFDPPPTHYERESPAKKLWQRHSVFLIEFSRWCL